MEMVEQKRIESFEFLREFTGESDRTAVILGVAKLEDLLHQLLIRRLNPNPSTKDPLFEDYGPLNTFKAKIDMCYRLGILDAEFTSCQNTLRKIQNDFAHDVTGCDLNAGPQKDRINTLCKDLKDKKEFKELHEELSRFGKTERSADFRVLLSILIFVLERRIERNIIKSIGYEGQLIFQEIVKAMR